MVPCLFVLVIGQLLSLVSLLILSGYVALQALLKLWLVTEDFIMLHLWLSAGLGKDFCWCFSFILVPVLFISKYFCECMPHSLLLCTNFVHRKNTWRGNCTFHRCLFWPAEWGCSLDLPTHPGLIGLPHPVKTHPFTRDSLGFQFPQQYLTMGLSSCQLPGCHLLPLQLAHPYYTHNFKKALSVMLKWVWGVHHEVCMTAYFGSSDWPW